MGNDGPARREIEDSTAARLAEIVAAAERAAKQVIDEAEVEARERIVEAEREADRVVAERLGRLVALADELDAQAEALRRGAEALQLALAQARSELGGGAESFGGSATIRRPGAGSEAAGPEPVSTPQQASDGDGDGMRPAAPSLTVVGGAPAPESKRELEPEVAGRPDYGLEPEAAADPDGESLGSPAGARLLATQMAVSGSSREEIEARLRSGFAIADTTSILDAILGPEL